MKTARHLVLIGLLLFAPAALLPAQDDPPPAEPAEEIGFRRDETTGLPLGWRGSKDSFLRALDWGLEQRFRYEWREGIGFDHERDDEFLLSRTRVWLSGEVGSALDFHFEGRDARAFGSDFLADGNPTFEDDFDIFQAYLTFKPADRWKLRAGRELLAFDDQRLIGGLLWTNTSRTFNTIHGIYEGEDIESHLGVARVVEIEPDELNGVNDDDDLYYFHTTFKNPGPQGMKASVFAYHRDLEASTEHTTLGARLYGELADSGLDYDLMGAYQFGDTGGNTNAYAAHAEVGYTFRGAAWEPRLALEGNLASGDDDPGSGDVETFDQLFPTNHNKYGIADLVGFRNQRNLGVHLQAKPTKKLSTDLAYYAFWVDQPEDALYNAGGAPIVLGGTDDERFVGHEIDLELGYKATDQLDLGGGIGYFLPGNFIENNAPDDDDFVFAFLQVIYKLH